MMGSKLRMHTMCGYNKIVISLEKCDAILHPVEEMRGNDLKCCMGSGPRRTMMGQKRE
jgi:hypothetical protein